MMLTRMATLSAVRISWPLMVRSRSRILDKFDPRLWGRPKRLKGSPPGNGVMPGLNRPDEHAVFHTTARDGCPG